MSMISDLRGQLTSAEQWPEYDLVSGDYVPRVSAVGNRRLAAVMIALNDRGTQSGAGPIEILLTRRAAHMRHHPGQISFPGGGQDGAETPAQTAVRETAEEVGIPAENLDILGALPALHAPRTNHWVVPVVSRVTGTPSLVLNSDEVASAHWVDVLALADPHHRVTWRRSHYSGPGFLVDGKLVWGFTATLCDQLLDRAGLALAWASRRVIDVDAG